MIQRTRILGTLLERAPSLHSKAELMALRDRGLAIEGGPQPIHLPKVNVSDDPKNGPVDVVMFCVKLWDTETAARQLLPLMQPATAVRRSRESPDRRRWR